MMSMDCIIWLEDEEGENEVEWSSGRKTGEHNTKNCYTKQSNRTEKLARQRAV